MRIRSVHPDLCVDEKMADVPSDLERTFVRLWTHCDDEGRCIDNARLIKAATYPLLDKMTPERLDRELDELWKLNLIVRYEVDGRRYIAVRSWDKYQHPQRASTSKYPAPPVLVADDARTPPRDVREPSRSGEGEGEGEGVVNPMSTSSTGLALVKPTHVDIVFDAWRESTGHRKAVLDPKRRRRIVLALRHYPVEDLVAAVKGWRLDAHCRGENDRHTVYNDLELLLRDAAHIEKFRDLQRGDTVEDEFERRVRERLEGGTGA